MVLVRRRRNVYAIPKHRALSVSINIIWGERSARGLASESWPIRRLQQQLCMVNGCTGEWIDGMVVRAYLALKARELVVPTGPDEITAPPSW